MEEKREDIANTLADYTLVLYGLYLAKGNESDKIGMAFLELTRQTEYYKTKKHVSNTLVFCNLALVYGVLCGCCSCDKAFAEMQNTFLCLKSLWREVQNGSNK